MKIAVLPGDGIGPEIMREAVKVLNGLGESFEFEEAPIGGAGYDVSGDPLPDGTLTLAKQADAILLGATGDWKYDKLDRKLRPEQGMLRLRKELQTSMEEEAQEKGEKLKRQVTDRLERKLADLRQELDQAVNRATAAALRQKAAQLGQIREMTEDPATGSLTIVVEV